MLFSKFQGKLKVISRVPQGLRDNMKAEKGRRYEMNTIVKTNKLSKEYEGVYRVKDVDVNIREGEIYGFLGPNGAGKSTTMKMLLELSKPTSGSVEIFGQEFKSSNRIKILKNIGSLIESPSYYGHLTGMENMRVIQKLLDLPDKNIKEAIHVVRMENQMSKKVKNYSLGMKQRLGIAMAIARFPKLLILDEPTNGLDPAGIEEVRKLIKSLPQKYGMTVMISSHLLSEIDQMATAVGIINHGKIIFQDSMDALRSQSKKYIAIRTQDNREAEKLLSDFKPAYKDKFLLLQNMDDEKVSKIVGSLVRSGINIFRVEEHQKTLEDIFLELTGKEITL